MSQKPDQPPTVEVDPEPSGFEDTSQFVESLAPDVAQPADPSNPSSAAGLSTLIPEGSGSASASPDKDPDNTHKLQWIGKILGHFKLKSLLGEGSMGVVFEAQDIHLKRTVALKVLRRRIVGTSENDRVTMFLREARAAAAINHPNIVQIHEIANLKGWWYLAMEYLDAGNLYTLVKSKGPLDHLRFCSVFADAAHGLNEAHDAGIIHRDIKPQNLMLTRKGRCKVADFGLVKFDDPNDLFHVNSRAVGTPQYIAPEVMLRQPATGASDVYSLGCAMYFCLAGRPPYLTANRKDYYNLHVNSPIPDVRERSPHTSQAIAQLIMRAMSKRATDRPTAAQLSQALTAEMSRAGIDLNATLSGQLPALTLADIPPQPAPVAPQSASSPTAPAESPSRPSASSASLTDPAIEARNKKLLLGAGALLAVSLSVLAGAVWFVSRKPSASPAQPVVATPTPDPQAQVNALMSQADALLAPLKPLAQEPGIAVPYAQALQLKAQVQQELRQPSNDNAKILAAKYLDQANALVLLNAQRLGALQVAKTASQAGAAANQAGGLREAVEEMSKAISSDAQGQRSFALGDFASAQTAWNNAASLYAQAESRALAWGAFNQHKQALTQALSSDNAKLAGQATPEPIAQAQALLEKALQSAQKQDPAAGVQFLRQAQALLDGALEDLRQAQARQASQFSASIEALLDTARKNDNPQNGQTALAALDKLLTLKPDHAQAKELQTKIKAYYALKPGQTVTNSVKMALAYIPPGEFIMGSPADEPGRKDDERQHKVKISRGFFMGVTEVTQAQWQEVMGKDYKSPDGVHPDDLRNRFLGDDLPADGISYAEAQAFCQALSKREGKKYHLPTEAQWEYAARAGSTTAFTTGPALSSDQANIDGYEPYPGAPAGVSRMKTLYAGTFAANAWGLKDMHGNVMEWTTDLYAQYPVTDTTDPTGPVESGPPDQLTRVLRGGSWKHYAAQARCANRSFYSPVLKANYIGFRVILETN
jgi:formylglycine-generating enzyme required for sulfatase activity/serine/threonine protein kinase